MPRMFASKIVRAEPLTLPVAILRMNSGMSMLRGARLDARRVGSSTGSGWPRRAPARSLAGAQGIVIIEDEQRDAPDKRPGEILEQDPPPGTVLTTREIRVVVAKAKEDLKIPTVTGKTLDEARVELEALGFEVPEPIAQDSNRTPGTVLAQEPKGGAKAPSGTDIKLTIASMPMLEVPKMTGKYLRTAKADLQNIGLELGEVRRTEHAEHGEGYVLRQEPAAGTKVPFGTAIKLTVVAPN
jgi:beta-lactam-binding protein with PASTA domain